MLLIFSMEESVAGANAHLLLLMNEFEDRARTPASYLRGFCSRDP